MKQEEIFEILKMGHSAFLTGPAGCGKTFLLNKYIKYLKDNKIKVGITASTGIAATHINGRTIHSWCGMGINESLTRSQMNSLMENGQLEYRIGDSKVLIIDEISMLNAPRLDLINMICQAFKRDERSFGGMQVILCGDLFQLPPIAKNGEDNNFIIKSDVWNSMDIKVCYFEEQYRQEDKRFLQVLNDIREGAVTEDTCNILKERLNKSIGNKIKPTKLHTHNNDVNAYNSFELNKLNGDYVNYEMQSEGTPHLVKSLKSRYCLAPEILKLKVNAIIMFVKNNFDKNYVNGTLGKVEYFDEDTGYPVVKTTAGDTIIVFPERWVIEEDDIIVASISQIPLRLAWAITVHKSQGMSLDCAEIDLSKTFEYGMGYVALSRLRSLAGMKLVGINKLALEVDKNVTILDKTLRKKSKENLEEFLQLSKIKIKKIQKEFIKNNKMSNSFGNIFGMSF